VARGLGLRADLDTGIVPHLFLQLSVA